MDIILEALTQSTLPTYISVGQKSYKQHYLHLWENENPNPYINRSFTESVVHEELKDANVAHFLVKAGDDTIGIVKLRINAKLDEHSSQKALLAEKIYLLNEFSGMGYGKKVLTKIESYAKSLDKEIVWLDTMQKGGPIRFYLNNGFSIKKEGELTIQGAKPSEKAMWVLSKAI